MPRISTRVGENCVELVEREGLAGVLLQVVRQPGHVVDDQRWDRAYGARGPAVGGRLELELNTSPATKLKLFVSKTLASPYPYRGLIFSVSFYFPNIIEHIRNNLTPKKL